MRIKLFFHKVVHWEYWPAWLVYFPFVFLWAWYAIRLKHPLFFIWVNPALKNGGFFNISKREIYELLPTSCYPPTLYVYTNQNHTSFLKNINFQFPVVVKPDKGLRGLGIHIFHTPDQLINYHQKTNHNYIIQPYVNRKNEAGIFFYKNQQTKQVCITGIVQKKFFSVLGDGTQTIRQLLLARSRYAMQLTRIEKNGKLDLDLILDKGVEFLIDPIGNHNRGTLFYNASDKICKPLTDFVHSIINPIDGLNYGRIDIKFDSWDLLNDGKAYSIIELNGGLSEPAHIYDPSCSYFEAVAEIYRHFNLLYQIASQNSSSQVSFPIILNEWKLHRKQLKLIDGIVDTNII